MSDLNLPGIPGGVSGRLRGSTLPINLGRRDAVFEAAVRADTKARAFAHQLVLEGCQVRISANRDRPLR